MNPPFPGLDPQAPIPSPEDYINLLTEQASLHFQIALARATYYEQLGSHIVKQIHEANAKGNISQLRQLFHDADVIWPYVLAYKRESQDLLRFRRN